MQWGKGKQGMSDNREVREAEKAEEDGDGEATAGFGNIEDAVGITEALETGHALCWGDRNREGARLFPFLSPTPLQWGWE